MYDAARFQKINYSAMAAWSVGRGSVMADSSYRIAGLSGSEIECRANNRGVVYFRRGRVNTRRFHHHLCGALPVPGVGEEPAMADSFSGFTDDAP